MSYTVICPSCKERSPGSLMSCPNCHTSLVGIPREQYPPAPSKPIRPGSSPGPKPQTTREGNWLTRLLLLLVKTFAIACLLGLTVSLLGWRVLHWTSSRQFSDGLFWTGAALAVLSYYLYRSEWDARRSIVTAIHVQPTGSLSLQERTQRWVTDAASTYRTVFSFFLVTLYLMGFSAFIGNLS